MCVWFEVVEDFAVGLSLGTLLIEKYAWQNLPAMRRLVPWWPQIVNIVVLTKMSQYATTSAVDTTKVPPSVSTTNNKHIQASVARNILLIPYRDLPALVQRGCSRTVVLNPTDKRAVYSTTQVLKDLVATAPKKTFHVLLTNMSNKLVWLPRPLTVAQIKSRPAHIIGTEAARLQTGCNTVRAGHQY